MRTLFLFTLAACLSGCCCCRCGSYSRPPSPPAGPVPGPVQDLTPASQVIEDPVSSDQQVLPPRDPGDLLHEDGTLDGAKTRPDLGPVTGDRDADGLTDTEEREIGTDPNNRDTDGDALLDGWEVKGVDGLRLFDPAMPGGKADPLHKDIYIEMDYMERIGTDAEGSTDVNVLGPGEPVIEILLAAFKGAPVKNPDDLPGITLHLDLAAEPLGYIAELDSMAFQALKANNFDWSRRLRVYHYMIWADRWKANDRSDWSGWSMEIPYSDFVVSLGLWHSERGGDRFEKTGTFMHELGHNLGLHHGGGSDDDTQKPNHLSVMNYTWQISGLLKQDAVAETLGHFHYQWTRLPALDERDLDEESGLGGTDSTRIASALRGFKTGWYLDGTFRAAAADGRIDWNRTRPDTESAVTIDLNLDGAKTILKATPNEWQILKFDGGAIGSGLPMSRLMERYVNRPPRFSHLVELDVLLAAKIRAGLARH